MKTVQQITMIPSSLHITLLLLCGAIISGKIRERENLKIAAFNVQVFGASKAGKPAVMSSLAQIIQRYDIILIQEIRDSKQTAIKKLLQQTNDLGPAQYDMQISARLGRTSAKEQYAFFYRKSTGMIEVVDTYQYPDTEDQFEREPYAVKFKSRNTVIQQFVLVGVHIDPDVAVQEIDSLSAVHNAIQSHWGTNDIAIMGDLNADCNYVSKKKLAELLLRKDDKYVWLIGDDVDTTTKSTDCAYDRIILTGSSFVEGVVDSSSQVFQYDVEYGLTPDQTTAISDHYPVEFSIKTKDTQSNEDTSCASHYQPITWLLGTYWAGYNNLPVWEDFQGWLW